MVILLSDHLIIEGYLALIGKIWNPSEVLGYGIHRKFGLAGATYSGLAGATYSGFLTLGYLFWCFLVLAVI